MIKKIALVLAVGSSVNPGVAFADPTGLAQFNLRVEVPVACSIGFESNLSEIDDGVWALGQTRELCNSTSGYVVRANYEPDTLVGAEMTVGGRQVTLDGSGQTIVYVAPGAANVRRSVSIAPGEAGFNTDVLTFEIQAA